MAMKLIDAEQVRHDIAIRFTRWLDTLPNRGAYGFSHHDGEALVQSLTELFVNSAALPDATPRAQWQPVSTMPDKAVLVKWPDSETPDIITGKMELDEILRYGQPPPTHWMPLPPAPGDAPCVARLGNLTTTVTGLDE